MPALKVRMTCYPAATHAELDCSSTKKDRYVRETLTGISKIVFIAADLN